MANTDGRCWIVDPTHGHADTLNLVPGYYKARFSRDGEWHLVHAQVIEDRDEAGDLMADVEYKLSIDGNFVLDWDARFPNGLTGYPLTKREFEALKADTSWMKERHGIGVGDKTDIAALPASLFLPPGA